VIILFLLPILYIVVYVIVTRTNPKSNVLAVAGDVIDCEGGLDWSQKNIYSSVSITPTASDKNNDRKSGLPMVVMPLKKSDLILHSRVYNGTSERGLHNTTKHFAIPDGYYNRPIYAWEGSVITIDVSLDYDITAPGPYEVVAYVLLGDDNFNSIYSNPSGVPRYEYKFDFLKDRDQIFQCTLHKRGYYYIVVRVKTDHNVQFSARVQFKYFSLDHEDYDFSIATPLQAVGITVQQPLHHSELVVCFSDEDDDLDSNTIHLDLKHDPRLPLVCTIPLMVWVPITIGILVARYVYYKVPMRRRDPERISLLHPSRHGH